MRVHGIDGDERELLKGHHGPVHCVEFSPDGEMYASGSGELLCSLFNDDEIDTALLWQRTVSTIEKSFPFNSIAKVIVIGTIRLWQTIPGKAYGLWAGTDS